MSILEDAIKKFGKEWVDKRIELSGHHVAIEPADPRKRTGTTQEEKFVFALLEMLDYNCFNFPNSICYTDIPKEEIENFLITHKETIFSFDIDPPSYIGVFVGTFDFLVKDKKGDKIE